MKTSETIDAISAALAKAQGEIANPAKDAQNPHFRSSYADLAGGVNAIRAPLAKNGLAYIQATRLDGDILMVDTRVSHSSGQWIESEFPACRFPAKPQEVGSALTYARRYALFAIVGIAGEDDDGNAANQTETPARKQQPVTADYFDAETSRTKRDEIVEDIQNSGDEAGLTKTWEKHQDSIKKLHIADKQVVIEAKDDRKFALKSKAA
jgi:ERF superfamily